MIADLNRYFDHSLLKPETTLGAIRNLCREAISDHFCGIAINPFWVADAKLELAGTGVKIISVSGFPLSANRTDVKVMEAVRGVEDGADEIDMVANVGLLSMGEFKQVENEISEVRKALPKHIALKVIIEAPLLSEEFLPSVVEAVINGGAQYVKTSTGFFGGATVELVKTLKKEAQGRIKIKASGGIRNLADTLALIDAGADRIGSSASVSIMKEYKKVLETSSAGA